MCLDRPTKSRICPYNRIRKSRHRTLCEREIRNVDLTHGTALVTPRRWFIKRTLARHSIVFILMSQQHIALYLHANFIKLNFTSYNCTWPDCFMLPEYPTPTRIRVLKTRTKNVHVLWAPVYIPSDVSGGLTGVEPFQFYVETVDMKSTATATKLPSMLTWCGRMLIWFKRSSSSEWRKAASRKKSHIKMQCRHWFRRSSKVSTNRERSHETFYGVVELSCKIHEQRFIYLRD